MAASSTAAGVSAGRGSTGGTSSTPASPGASRSPATIRAPALGRVGADVGGTLTDLALVGDEVRDGLLTPERARSEHGLALTADGEADRGATSSLRRRARAALRGAG